MPQCPVAATSGRRQCSYVFFRGELKTETDDGERSKFDSQETSSASNVQRGSYVGTLRADGRDEAGFVARLNWTRQTIDRLLNSFTILTLKSPITVFTPDDL